MIIFFLYLIYHNGYLYIIKKSIVTALGIVFPVYLFVWALGACMWKNSFRMNASFNPWNMIWVQIFCITMSPTVKRVGRRKRKGRLAVAICVSVCDCVYVWAVTQFRLQHVCVCVCALVLANRKHFTLLKVAPFYFLLSPLSPLTPFHSFYRRAEATDPICRISFVENMTSK